MVTNSKRKQFFITLFLIIVITLYTSILRASEITLTWGPPTKNADGTQLTDLAGYIVYYGLTSGKYDNFINVVGKVTQHKISNLAAETTYYLNIKAYDTSGNQSVYAGEITRSTSTVNIAPTANPGGPYAGIEGQSITLSGLNSRDTDGSIVLYEWDINNDGIYDYHSSTPTQAHTYAQQNTNTIKLKVTDNKGAAGISTTTVRVSDTIPTAAFSMSLTNTPYTIQFLNNSAGYDRSFTYAWDFDNNGSIDSNALAPSYTYSSEGTYTAKLTVRDADGSANIAMHTHHISLNESYSLSHSSHSFKDTCAGDNGRELIRVLNSGIQPLTFRQISLAGSGAIGYSIQNDTCTGRSIGRNNECSFEVIFLPSSAAYHNAILQITSVNSLAETSSLSVSGKGLDCSKNEIVVDNNDPGFTPLSGTWNVSGYSESYKSISLYSSINRTGATAWARWIPVIPRTGIYDVFAWWTAGASGINDATYQIINADGSEFVTVNQKIRGGQWNYLGTYRYNEGSTGRVRLSNYSQDPNYAANILSAYVVADAVKFTLSHIDNDGDGISYDGDGSGLIGDNLCTGGNIYDCDDNCPGIANADQSDLDNDGVGDACDNCRNVSNPDQGDANVDEDDNTSLPGSQHYGNACDADFDNNGLVGLEDYNLFSRYFNQAVPPAPLYLDLNGNKKIGLEEFNIIKKYYRLPPGPGIGD